MEKYITDERTGLKYELIGDYYLIAGDEAEQEHIGLWGQRHCKYLRKHKHCTYSALLISGKLDSYLQEIDRHAETMFARLMKEMAQREKITEELKVADQMAWVGAMNSIQQRVTEIVNQELIYA